MTDAAVTLDRLATVPDRITLMARADPEVLDLVHAHLGHLWTGHPEVAEADRVRFETAVTEVVGNIIAHAYRHDSGHPGAGARRFQLVLGVADDAVMAVLGDNGLPVGLDLRHVTMPDADAESGRGLAMARAALHELDYTRVGDCNQWSLVRRRGQP